MVDSNGNVFVVDSINQRIRKFDNAFNFTLKWEWTVLASHGGVAVDGSGNVFVADSGNNLLQAFMP